MRRIGIGARLSIALMGCWLLLFPALVFAQITTVDDTTSTPIAGAGHDYIRLLSETWWKRRRSRCAVSRSGAASSFTWPCDEDGRSRK